METTVKTAAGWFSDEDLYLFGQGTNHRIYEKMGAHPTTINGKKGVYFTVWAPAAQRVSVVGDFNNWNSNDCVMERNKMGIWEKFIPDMKVGEKYKYALIDSQGQHRFKTDPFGYKQELRPATASIVAELDYAWHDQDWINRRNVEEPYQRPVSIYEVHLGSWMHENWDTPAVSNIDKVGVPYKDKARFLNYRELADRMIPYVKKMGYTHIELMPITEFPFDGSWGYQVVGFFAPTSRFGSPQDFMYFVDQFHQAGIGVIMDWVPGHFPKDDHGLARFDGDCLFEHLDPRKGEHQIWGTLAFNYERNEVRNFLISSALFWFEKYHIDGIRVDAVASIIYLNYERTEWIPNIYGGAENLEGIQFLQELNTAIFKYYPNVLSIAEESTTYPNVSRPVDQGGLGFNFKWNMGWMNDTLKYFLTHPHDRSNVHEKLTFSIWYAFTENFVLALSHDEVAQGKGHIWQKMGGLNTSVYERAADMRTLFTFMFGHPGKKTMFMGMEIGQTHEWQVYEDVDWDILQHETHQKIQLLVQDLHKIYKNEPALYTNDFGHDGFEWIDWNDAGRGLVSFVRKDIHSDQQILVVCNCKPFRYENFWLGTKQEGIYEEILNTDNLRYGGADVRNLGELKTRHWHHSHWPFALEITVPPMTGLMFKKKRNF
jgi:1,4-alpha-glucan branching enzyme